MDKSYLGLACCPFCGSQGEHKEVVMSIIGHYDLLAEKTTEDQHAQGYVIMCSHCGVQTAPKETWSEAEVAWGDRPESFPISTTHAKVC